VVLSVSGFERTFHGGGPHSPPNEARGQRNLEEKEEEEEEEEEQEEKGMLMVGMVMETQFSCVTVIILS